VRLSQITDFGLESANLRGIRDYYRSMDWRDCRAQFIPDQKLEGVSIMDEMHPLQAAARRRDEVDVVAWLRSKGEIERAEWLRRTGSCSLTLAELCEIALTGGRRN
jgi:hypothetical protein